MQMIKKLCMILALVLCLSVPVQADAIVNGGNSDKTVDYYVKVSAPDGGVNFRYGAGVEYDQIISNMIPNGVILHIVGERTANTGRNWGYTEYQGMWGYVSLSQTSFYDKAKEDEKEAAAKAEAERQEALKKEAEEQEALKREAEEQEALKREAEEQEALKKEAEEQEALKKEAEEQEALKKEAKEQEALKKEAEEQKALEKKAKEQEASGKDAKKQETEDTSMNKGFLLKVLALAAICLIAAVTAGFLIVYYKTHRPVKREPENKEAENTLREGEVFCRYCGRKNSIQSEYCCHCGKKIK